MARILVIDDDTGLLQMVKLMLEREGHQAALAEGGEAGIRAALAQVPDIAIIDLMMPGISGYDVTRQLRSDSRTAQMPIMILTARSQPMDKQMAMNAGASAFMSKPVSARELTNRVAEMLAVKPEAAAPPAQALPETPLAPSTISPAPLSAAVSTSSGGGRRLPIGAEHSTPSAPAAALPTAAIKTPDKTPPVIAVFALGGGSGGTTLAINLAFMLRRSVERVCLVDLSTSGGNVAPYLRLALRGSWADLLPLGDKFDARAIGSAITPHPQQGLAVIGAPAAVPNRFLSAEAVTNLYNTLTAGFQQIVVDVSSLDAASVATLALARSVLVVIGDDLTAIQANGSLATILQSAAVDLKNVRVIVNRSRPEATIPASAIAKTIGLPISGELPYDPNQIQALRRGVPTVVLAPESSFASALQQLSRTL